MEMLCHLLLHILEAKIHLPLHLAGQTLNLRTYPLLHGCKVWDEVPSWRSPLWLHWTLWRWHGMLCCRCSHVSIIIIVTSIIIMPMFCLIHVITGEGSQRPQ